MSSMVDNFDKPVHPHEVRQRFTKLEDENRELYIRCADMERQVKLLLECVTGLMREAHNGQREGIKAMGEQDSAAAKNGTNHVGRGNC